MKKFWDERYSQEEMIYGNEPNEFFREQIQNLKPGKILLPAEGEGRNAVFAATQGWDVHAFDFSDAGRTKALKLASKADVSIDYQLSTAEDFECTPESLDVVALIYAHFPAVTRLSFHAKILRWLKPGGKVILEAFHPKQLQGYPSGGPKDETMLYTPYMLKKDFEGLTITLLEEKEIELSEGTYHLGKGYVTRLVATKS
jgi:2-polyprenyl-3-methyl-5-hydroxy-6-metoxy-1,4-benzoquinol methylase